MTRDEAERRWNDAALSAYHRIVEESGKSLTRIAADMGVREGTLERMVKGQVRWSLNAALDLAVATGQDPVRMLAREALP